MPAERPPQEIVDLAEARAAARRARDWSAADELRSRIEAAGWRVVDSGTLYDLERAVAADIQAGGAVRYGSSTSVPSRLGDPATGTVTVVLLATDWPDDLGRAVRALESDMADGTQVVIVANGPSAAQEAALESLASAPADLARPWLEIVWTAGRLGHAAALNAGIRRAAAPVVIVLDASLEPVGDLASALAAALDDATVAVSGPVGLVTDDFVHFESAAAGATDVDAIDGRAIAFRRSDYARRGPLDEHFAVDRGFGPWWSLVLRDQDAEDADEAPPRRAVQAGGALATRHEPRDPSDLSAADLDRHARKNGYRLLKRFATRRDLLTAG